MLYHESKLNVGIILEANINVLTARVCAAHCLSLTNTKDTSIPYKGSILLYISSKTMLSAFHCPRCL